ncbi:MAG: long-chain fatty acid--CoA ligase [Betaproteobacteria bacterium]|nr:long-chain fatty acid--CoA ligase [Betaproteobacteria bacterium]
MTPLEVLQRYPAHDYTLLGALTSRARSIPEHCFIEFGDARLSYAQTAARVREAMALLAAKGVKPGDRIALMSHNHPTTVVLLIALAALGAIMVGVNPDFGEKEARYVLEHSEASGIVCSLAALATVQAVAGALPARPWIMSNEPNLVGLPTVPGALHGTGDAAPATIGLADDVCIIIYTSGTTGFPKGVMHSQRSVVLAGEGFVRRMHLDPAERLLCIMPMFHVNAIFYSLFGTIAAGATLLLEEKFSASQFWSTVARRKATTVNTIAAVMNILMRRPREEFVPGHTLTKIYGAPFSPEIYRVFEEEFGVPHLIEGYGMSEIPGACSNPYDGERRKGSMGKPSLHPDPAVNLAQVKIVDEEGNDAPAGTTGEIAVRTPTIMQGYYRDPAASAAAFRDGYFFTGDLGWIDADGYAWFVARKKDIIRRRGENIAGAEIDRVVGDHPEVVEAAAIGVPAELGEEEVLLAVLKKAGSGLTEREVADWCRARLAPFKVPRFVLFVDTLPRTATHRIAKFELRKDATLQQRALDLAKMS